MKMKTYTAADFVLTPAQAKAMVAAREKKRRKTKRVTRRANGRGERPGPNDA